MRGQRSAGLILDEGLWAMWDEYQERLRDLLEPEWRLQQTVAGWAAAGLLA